MNEGREGTPSYARHRDGEGDPLPEPGHRIGIEALLAGNGTDLGFVFTSSRNPGEVYSVDTRSGRLERWTKGFSAIGPEAFSEPQQIKWTSFDGRSISGYLLRPPEKFTGKRPVIIDLHGGHGISRSFDRVSEVKTITT